MPPSQTGTSPPKIAYVTGTDANRLINTAILVASFEAHLPAQHLHVCDLGLADNEARFWQKTGLYLPRPAPLPGGMHPWKYKASICNYVNTAEYDAVVWLDADMVVLADFHDQVLQILAEMGHGSAPVAVAPDDANLCVDEMIRRFEQLGKDTGSFKELMARFGKNGSDPYYNTGFWIITDFDLAEKWSRITRKQEDWVLFEQNVFNVLVGEGGYRVLGLPTDVWNVHGNLLKDVRVGRHRTRANLLHTTSAEQRHHIENHIEYPIGDRVLAGWFKLFERADLKDVQQHYLLDFLRKNLELIRQCNLLKDPSRA